PKRGHEDRLLFNAHLHNGSDRRPLGTAVALLSSGYVIFSDFVARVEHYGLLAALKVFSTPAEMEIETSEVSEFLQQLFTLSLLPPLKLPESLAIAFASPVPQPVLHAVAYPADDGSTLFADARVLYGMVEVDPREPGSAVMDPDGKTILMRNPKIEAGLEQTLQASGFNIPPNAAFHPKHLYSVSPRSFPRAAEALISAGWKVMANGKPFRRVGEMSFKVSSGMDWFDLKAQCDFDGVRVDLPDILKAVKAGDMSIVLGDGSVGMLPEEWLERHRYLLDSATIVDGQLRFKASQAMLLDAVLAEQPTVNFDETFMRVREKLSRFTKIDAVSPSPEFKGQLRPYQEEGLGWLLFLQEFGLGGCLADDMGLGKTIQVLALLTHRKRMPAPGAAAPTSRHLPSLVVVPRSLVFNWEREAAKFAPGLRVLCNTGPTRETSAKLFAQYDIVLMTYGTVRSDAITLRSIAFDFVILDEAQAIKNANTATAKAVRLLQGRNRLALSGTPIENHIGELWSLFEFLNPGMLGSSRVFSKCVNENGDIKEGARDLVARAVRPFILRRTKSQVAKDLPEKMEETIFCELLTEQRKIYTDLRDHYRTALLGDPNETRIPKNKFQVLEALLRLRQVACHPGLIDPARLQDSSAKLEIFIDTVVEVVDSGRKVLAFSQFTSLLAIVRDRLDKQNIVYEYLDGKTRKRQEKVDRFQNDVDCKVFLISLKAGGYGLNLTAAEYVFLLDPWWNPAVESQAIDRAHRIGQTRKVFAYRFIARDTVEEKVLELQKTKRQLADAILGADNSLLHDLERKDLELLLS
ncbi:MAG: DEAD/DEAH box helicase, partial [Verrucomicrobia bacterium]|nr:DEAD/DEAH box helicase [Verrucomicrobiota bacterium]